MRGSFAALTLALMAPGAPAATPALGTISLAQPTLTYQSGPFAAQNTSDVASPACMNPAQPCDDFALTVDVPADYRATHPRDLIFVSTKWTVQNFDAYALYVYDSAGRLIDYFLTEADPVVVSVPAARGTYTLRIVPQQPSPEFLTTTVTLLPDATGARATGGAPRFIAHLTPGGVGESSEAEMNIGYNPLTQRVFTLGFVQTLRAAFGDAQSPALPECCDAAWTDVSDSRSSANTNDPILFTDQATGRTFVAQLQAQTPSDSIFVYTDDDGASWTLSPQTLDGGIDHQSVGAGPYAAGGAAAPAGAYPHAVYYCSQSVIGAFCTRSDDGGYTFAAPSILKTAADCDGFTPAIHGHVKVAPDGTVYVPDRNCGGQQAVIVSEDSGASWHVRRLPAAGGRTGSIGDSSLGIGSDGTVYDCYLNGDGHAHVAVSKDRGLTWFNDRDIGYAGGVVHAVFPEAVAGDPDRAACAFLGTTTRGGNFQLTSFDGLWYAYIATTYDGGNTWHTVNATPDDPVQGRGGVSLGGTTAIENRNLLDFNEITLDEKGRVLFGYNDGCLGNCILTGEPNQIALTFPTFFGPDVNVININADSKTAILRQSGGRGLYAAFDTAEPRAPKAACLSGGRDASKARLLWKVPDNNGADIAGYRIYRGTAQGGEAFLAEAGPTVFFDDTTASPLVVDYWYKVTAVNARGEGLFSNTLKLSMGTGVPPASNSPPVAALSANPSQGGAPLAVTLDAGGTTDADGDAIRSYTFDFGDGSEPVTQAGATIQHTYTALGTYRASVKAVDTKANRSQNAGTATITLAPPGPEPFAFLTRTNVMAGVYVTSETKTLGGFSGTLALSIDNGGQYSVNGGAWTSAAGQVAAGSTLAVRHVSASTANTGKISNVGVGTYSTPFRTVTGSIDRTPDPFDFGTQLDVEPGAAVESVVVALTGFNASIALTPGPGLAYRIDGGTNTTAAGTLLPGQALQVGHVASASHLGYTKTYLKAGGVTGYFTTRTK